MTDGKWPMPANAGGGKETGMGEVYGFLNFYAQEFELYVDQRSAFTSGKVGDQSTGGHRTTGGLHNITLPYVNTIANETSTWSTNNSNDYLNRTDADSGYTDILTDMYGDLYDMVDFWYKVQTVNMEVSNAGYKGPVLRQRHYTYNLINRSGNAEEGEMIGKICRAFQASVYPKMSPGMRVADNIMMPPPMWTISYDPGVGISPDVNKFRKGSPYTETETILLPIGGGVHLPVNVQSDERGENPDHPSVANAGTNAWRWNMDPFTSVLVNVSISPTSATDAIQVPTASGWPLVTVLKLSFLEVDQVLANQQWDAIVPYSWAQDEGNKFWKGGNNTEASNL
mgnify:CR=1 FL=1